MINVVHNSDCLPAMREMADNQFGLAIVDPPYGIGEFAQRNHFGDRPTAKWKNPNSQKYKTFNDNNPPEKEYFSELFRVSENQIIWGSNNFTEFLPKSTGWIVWDKRVNPKEHLAMCELAFSSFDRRCLKFEYLWAGFKKQEQVVRIHPTQKPVALYKWLLKNYAKEGITILDTHVGSGSSRIACWEMGYDFTGYEIDKDYWEAQEKRFMVVKNQQRLFV